MSEGNASNLQPRKRFKLSESSQPLYEFLYKQQQFVDVTIVILNKNWQLHKAILKQSGYFAGMFSGSWKESGEQVIQVEVNDPNITHDSVDAVFGSLYSFEIELGLDNIVSILATASLLQVQHVTDKCCEVMREYIGFNNVFAYYNAGESYGLPCVMTSAYEWLETNVLWLQATSNIDQSFLENISIELMSSLISSPNFVVCGHEMSIYRLLKQWLAVIIGKLDGESVNNFYKRQAWPAPFLMTKEGAKYKLPFQSLKMEHLLVYDSFMKMKVVRTDNILPSEWIISSYEKLWDCHLRIASRTDLGPTKIIDERQFNEKSLRCGLFLNEPPKHYAYTTEASQFSMDFSVLLNSSEGHVSVGRGQSESGLSNIYHKLEKRNILIKVSLISIDEGRRVTHVTRSPILHFCLGPSEKVKVMDFDEGTRFPLYMVIQWLTVTP